MTHVVDLVAPLARPGVKLEYQVDPDTPSLIGDMSRIIQILYNLAGNALKFTHSGRVCVNVRPGGGGDHYVSIEVTDTGVGIPKDKLGTIFKAFEQVSLELTHTLHPRCSYRCMHTNTAYLPSAASCGSNGAQTAGDGPAGERQLVFCRFMLGH